ncbi:eukaryotic translation initiation factor 2 (eIF-2) family protein [Trifolium repens]|jgi:hypothetical protein|nr:eukaryotic translation initiation factor 2 (eIF-2) family protein [Trifolium repens]
MEGKKDEDFEALSASFLDVDDEINNLSVAAEKEDVILLRFPICCVIGHSYIGKTKLLNYIRGAADFEFEDNTTTKRITAAYVPSFKIYLFKNGIMFLLHCRLTCFLGGNHMLQCSIC